MVQAEESRIGQAEMNFMCYAIIKSYQKDGKTIID